MKKAKLLTLIMSLIMAIFVFGACIPGPPGDDGTDGTDGTDGIDGIDGVTQLEVDPEGCAICHNGSFADAGVDHQDVYDDYADDSTLELTIDDVESDENGDGTFTATITFTVTKDGEPFVDVAKLPLLGQKTFYAVTYDSATRTFDEGNGFPTSSREGSANTIVPTATPGQYTVTDDALTYDILAAGFNGMVYGYVAYEQLDSGPLGGYVKLYNDVSSAGISYGDADTYESSINVSGCEKCHGTPYMKHGYRDPVVDGLADVASCKTCHYDSRDGGHEDWQILVDDPERFAEIHAGDDLTVAEEAKYAYKATVMNDTHMSHAMEFPYPQSMSNCVTCHDGKLDMILTTDNFVESTCKSCHPMTGPEGGNAKRAPSLEALWDVRELTTFHEGVISTTECNDCHGDFAQSFSDYHSGYDKHIATDAGVRFDGIFEASIDSASVAANVLTINFSVTEDAGNPSTLSLADIIPTVMISLYGYDTKDFIVSAHSRDDDRNRFLELDIDGESTNPRITVVSAAGGSWEITADLSLWAGMIDNETVKRVEIGVMPALVEIVGERDSRDNGEEDDTEYGVDSVSRTFDLAGNAFDDDYYSEIVDVEKCNACHDVLGTTSMVLKEAAVSQTVSSVMFRAAAVPIWKCSLALLTPMPMRFTRSRLLIREMLI